MQMSRACALAAVLFLLAVPAQARDMTGKGGVGMLLTTEGVPMASFRYWRTNFALEGLIGYVSTTPVPARLTHPDTTQVRFSLGFLYRIGDAPKASLAIGLRPWAEYLLTSWSLFYRPDGQTLSPTENSCWRFGTEIPLHGEVFLNDHFSLVGHVGLTFDFGPPIGHINCGTAPNVGKGDPTLVIGLRGGFAGGAGASYYF
jgi:hypothetical protein